MITEVVIATVIATTLIGTLFVVGWLKDRAQRKKDEYADPFWKPTTRESDVLFEKDELDN